MTESWKYEFGATNNEIFKEHKYYNTNCKITTNHSRQIGINRPNRAKKKIKRIHIFEQLKNDIQTMRLG